eukprot:TRINITY_DN7824_c0_g7_i1.p1 TRINITY_DN7824_c0_g7~~TRINITY_DN7824_c0_g7_i1.p1  ORF type:complete len:485 (-),score=70.17 TRINITY_DN7824_c0_g7_i1:248-1702(-)
MALMRATLRTLRSRALERSLASVPLPTSSHQFCIGASRLSAHLRFSSARQVGNIVGAVGSRRFSSAIPGGCYEHYMSLKASGKIKEDPRQEVCIKMLDDLAKQVANYYPSMARAPRATASQAPPPGSGFLGGLFGTSKPSTPAAPATAKGQIGLYLWGGTGTGKTFMMDMFYDKLPIEKKKRIHFHEWMIDVHQRLHKRHANTDKSADDVIELVAEDMMKDAWLLCFDEFQVTHISDAIIMKRIFTVLFERGAVVVATSNRPPDDLYLNGLNRQLFMPFIPMLKQFCTVHDIGAEVDYRMISTKDVEDDRVFIFPNEKQENTILEHKFAKVCEGTVLTGSQIELQGRKLRVPRKAKKSKVAWFNFSDLCDKPLGAADYLALGSAFHTIFIADIPRLTMQERDQVRRFITCIDSLYERKTKVVCTAATDPIRLFHVSDEERKTSIADEIFAWDRTVSRLTEMQSTAYLSEAASNLEPVPFSSLAI